MVVNIGLQKRKGQASGEWTFILFYAVFSFALIGLTSQFGQTILMNSNIAFTPPPAPTSIFDVLGFIVGNIIIFFQLMFISSAFAVLDFIWIAFSIVMFYIILRLLHGGG
jgi:hypothetical protein